MSVNRASVHSGAQVQVSTRTCVCVCVHARAYTHATTSKCAFICAHLDQSSRIAYAQDCLHVLFYFFPLTAQMQKRSRHLHDTTEGKQRAVVSTIQPHTGSIQQHARFSSMTGCLLTFSRILSARSGLTMESDLRFQDCHLQGPGHARTYQAANTRKHSLLQFRRLSHVEPSLPFVAADIVRRYVRHNDRVLLSFGV